MVITKYKEIEKQLNFTPSSFQAAKHIVVDALLGFAIFLLLKQGSLWGYWCAQVFLPVLFFRAFALMHECVHGACISNKKLNIWIGYISGAFCFLPFFPWQMIHLQHHYWAGNIDRDPTMKIAKNFNPNARANGVLRFAWRSWIPILAVLTYSVFWMEGARYLRKSNSKGRWSVAVMSYLVPFIVYFTLGYFGVVTIKNILPGLIAYFVMVEVINFPHHLRLPQYRGEHFLAEADQHEVSRSCYYPKWFSRFVVNNFNYHTEHHLFPQLPWYRLFELSKLLKPILGNSYNESFRNSWILENRRRKMDDVILFEAEKVSKVGGSSES